MLGTSLNANPPPRDRVLLLHGLGRTARSMKRIEWDLRARGYDVVNITYPTRQCSIQELADHFLPPVIARCAPSGGARLHIVTHSLGGILTRAYLEHHTIPQLGRVVMLAPPNQGSELADVLRRVAVLRWIMGPAFLQLGTAEHDLPRRLGPVRFEAGVLMGNRSMNPLFSAAIPGPDDGKVSVASARVEGMKDFLVLPTSHTWMPWRRMTLDQIAHFLEHGRFRRAISG
jgi:alpha-beta hydrolase superfamily lysophospholipase